MILVTGASGFLGRHMARHLSTGGVQVRCLYHGTPPGNEMAALPGLSWMKCDLLDVYDVAEAMQGIAAIYHCAAIVSYNPGKREQMVHFNVESTANVVNQALEQQINKMVHVSSIAAIGRNANKQEITEEEEWDESEYNSAYGLSKHLAELEVWRGIGEGLNAAIINPGIILGPGNWDAGSAKLMKIVAKEFPYYTKGVTAWADVADVVRIMTMLMNSDIAEERFIVSAGNYAYKDIFTQMAQALGKKPPHIKANGFMTNMVWRMAMLKSRLTGTEATITKETARNAQEISQFDNSKLLKFFPGFAYTPVTDTIKNMAKVYLAEND